jgi:cytochrome c553
MPRLVFALSTSLALTALACSDSTAPADAPANHTVNRDGRWHAPGLNQPEGVCTACHGADLRGGTDGQPSCYSCHGKKWN